MSAVLRIGSPPRLALHAFEQTPRFFQAWRVSMACAASHFGLTASALPLAISISKPCAPASIAERLADSTMLATPVA